MKLHLCAESDAVHEYLFYQAYSKLYLLCKITKL